MMTNKERYRQAFGAVKAPDGLAQSVMEHIEQNKREVSDMKKTSRTTKRIIAVLAAVFVLIIGTGTAYAANVGGIQRTWVSAVPESSCIFLPDFLEMKYFSSMRFTSQRNMAFCATFSLCSMTLGAE